MESSNNYIDGSSNITVDPKLFPHKEYIISQIHRVLKYSETDSGSVTIQNHEGKEITVEELVNKYYDNPTDYFDPGSKDSIYICENSEDNLGQLMDNLDNSQIDLPPDLEVFQDDKISRQEQIEDQIDKMFADYYGNDGITKKLEDILDDYTDSI